MLRSLASNKFKVKELQKYVPGHFRNQWKICPNLKPKSSKDILMKLKSAIQIAI